MSQASKWPQLQSELRQLCVEAGATEEQLDGADDDSEQASTEEGNAEKARQVFIALAEILGVAAASLEACAICFQKTAVAIQLPCPCNESYHFRCWDRSLVKSLKETGASKCPTCRAEIRVDYDGQSGGSVFSQIVQAKVEYGENWTVGVDNALQKHGLEHDDEGFNFFVRDRRGQPAKIWHRLCDSISFDQHRNEGGLQQMLRNAVQRSRNRSPEAVKRNPEQEIPSQEEVEGPSVKDRFGTEVDPDGLEQEHFPISVKYPKKSGEVLLNHEQTQFPLTLTFKEYCLEIDNTVAAELPSLRNLFADEPAEKLVLGDTCVSLASKWKDNTRDGATGVQLHAGDWIIEVDGLRGSREQLMAALDKKAVLKLRVQQADSVAATSNVYQQENAIRQRLQRQTEPRQRDILRQYGAAAARNDGVAPTLTCVCGGSLKRLGIHAHVCKLVESVPKNEHGVVKIGETTYTVEQLIRGGRIRCDLCFKGFEAGDKFWACENYGETSLHAQAYGICDNCVT